MDSKEITRLCNFINKTAKYVDFVAIRFFADKKYQLISQNWIEEYSNLDFTIEQEDSLSNILREAQTFKFDDFVEYPEEDLSKNKCVNIKVDKHKQLIYFGKLLIKLCKENNINRVLDIGCGLGHLSGWLSENSDLELVGIDYNKKFCEKGSNLYGKVIFHTIDITDKEAFRNLLNFEGKRSAIVSLHGCGDVQAILLNEFIESNANLLLTIGCCYHKMKKTENNEWLLSNTFRNELNLELKRHVLRHACEYRPKNHLESPKKDKFFSFISRSIVEVFYERLNINSSIQHRSTRRKLGNTLDEIKYELIKRYNIEGGEREKWLNVFDQIVKDYKKYFPFVKVFLELQICLQESYEMLVLMDRLKYLHEHDIKAELRPVFDVKISSRNMCIIANK